MGRGSFWTRLIGKNDYAAESNRRELIDTVISAYGAELEQSSGYICDEKELPFPKHIIKKAIIEKLKYEQDPQMQENLKSGYFLLAHYQGLTEEMRNSVDEWNAVMSKFNDMDSEERLDRMQASSNWYPTLLQECKSEQKTLEQELSDEGLLD